MIADLLTQTATIIHRSESGTTDDYGNDIPSETQEEVDCYLEQRRRTEDDELGEVSEADYLLILPAGTAIDTGDVAVVDERAYELIGDPWSAHDPDTSADHHIEATVRRTAGEEDLS